MKRCTEWIIVLVLVTTCFRIVEGKAGAKKSKGMRKGLSKVIDVEKDGFDARTEFDLEDINSIADGEEREKRSEKSKKRIRRKIDKHCSSDIPAPIFKKSKSGLLTNYIATLCDTDEDRSFRQMFRQLITSTGILPHARVRFVELKIPTEEKLQQVAKHPNVAFIEQGNFMKMSASCTKQTFDNSSASSDFPWGIDRVGRKYNEKLDGLYKYSSTNLDKICVYVIDTGVRPDSPELTSVQQGVVCDGDGCSTNRNGITASDDENGHGTHVAGIIASLTWGLTKRACIIPVRLYDFFGDQSKTRYTLETVVKAIKYALEDATTNRENYTSIINLSIGGPRSPSLDLLIEEIASWEIPVVVAAGNENKDACDFSPAGTPSAFTVGSSNSLDEYSSFSNFGTCVDLAAPGESIRSTKNSGVGQSVVMQGTSMSAPFVSAAIAAVYAQFYGGDVPLTNVSQYILSSSIYQEMTKVPADTKNKLLYAPCYRK